MRLGFLCDGRDPLVQKQAEGVAHVGIADMGEDGGYFVGGAVPQVHGQVVADVQNAGRGDVSCVQGGCPCGDAYGLIAFGI